MTKPKILYASPFWPMKSGISEYSEALIWGLSAYFEITIIIDDYILENKKIKDEFKIIKYSLNKVYDKYEFIIYNMGNNPFYHSYIYNMMQNNPGYVILHDFVLYYLTVGYYGRKNKLFQKIYELEGVNGIQIVKDSLFNEESQDLLQHKLISTKLPLNSEILKLSKGVFVHSYYTKKLIENENIKVPIYVIKLPQTLPEREKALSDKKYLNQKYNIPDNAFIIGSAGFIAPSKQNEIVCKAVKEYNNMHKEKIYYVMIGEGNYVDNLLDDYIIKTGFINNEDFINVINSCDLIFNLRYPYNGESSSTLIQCMDFGKLCVVTDVGWFGELPDDTVIKVPVDITVSYIVNLILKLQEMDINAITINARKYVRTQCSVDIVAQNIYDYVNS